MLLASLTGLASEQIEPAGSLAVPRKNHTATVLPDGRVVVIGGENNFGQLNSAEIFDPATKSFVNAGAMSQARVGHAATLLPNGTVLVTGGRNESGALTTAEIFDPAGVANFRMVSAQLGAPRVRHTSTLLVNGTVLLKRVLIN